MSSREKLFLTIMMFFAAVSLGGVTLFRQIHPYSRLFAALPIVFIGGVTTVFSSKRDHNFKAESDRKESGHSIATGMYDFPPKASWDFPANMHSEILAPIDEIICADEVSLDMDMAAPCASVLIVAPTEADIELIKNLLRPYGMRVDCVDNGQSAIELIAADDLKYDAIFIDYPIPVMDGFETVDLIRGIASEYALSVPIIAVSSDKTIGKDAFMEKKFQAFVAKSACAVELDGIINRWVREEARSAPNFRQY